MKVRASTTQETTQQIITNGVSNLHPATASQLPAIRHIRRWIRRRRAAVRIMPPLPTSRATVVIPAQFLSTINGDQFLLYDSGVGNNDRIILFGTRGGLDLMRDNPNWFMDGTFKTVPSIFFQLYTIHVVKSGYVLPCIFGLLPNKTGQTYQAFFNQLITLEPLLAPQTIMSDFELAAMNAAVAVWNRVQLTGCLFHLSQCIYRRIQREGLQDLYASDHNISVQVRMLVALAFLPVAQVVAAFEAITPTMAHEIQPIIDYFEDNFIGRPLRQGRRPPQFAIAVWNQFDRAQAFLPRTNNHVEGWHRRLQVNIGGHHPNFWHFLTVLQKEQSLTEMEHAQLLTGQPPPPQRKRYQDCNARILALVIDHANRTTDDYLRGIAYNLKV